MHKSQRSSKGLSSIYFWSRNNIFSKWYKEMPPLGPLPYFDFMWGWDLIWFYVGLFFTLGKQNLESIKKDNVRKYEKVLHFVNDQ